MEELENNIEKGEHIFSQAIRAGKRTYFMDVRTTKSNDYYITITESKRRFDNDQGKFIHEKHKLFLYQEDFDKFLEGLTNIINGVKTFNFQFNHNETSLTDRDNHDEFNTKDENHD
jgi:Protein of unknown function (DUF3276).